MIDAVLSWTALPNLHPALVHFPIALVPVAILADLLRLVLRREEWLDRAATGLYVAAALGSLAALWAGERAADGLIAVPAAVQPLIGRHSDWAHYAVYALGGLAVLRLTLIVWKPRSLGVGLRLALLVPSLAAMGLLSYVADLGGALVFRHGVAVGEANPRADRTEPAEVEPATPPLDPPKGTPAATESAASRLTRAADGSLSWRPLAGDAAALGEILTPAPGFSSEVVVWRQPAPSRGLTLEINGETLLILPGTFSDVQVEATLDLAGFEGTVGVAHHVGGAGDGGFFTLSTDGKASLFDVREGARKKLNEKTTEIPEGSFTLAVSAAGKHLKGLLDGRTVTHGHIAPGPAGACGLLLDGKGSVRILGMTVTSLPGH